MLEFRQDEVSCRQANQNVAASQLRLMTTKPLTQHTLRAIAVHCARKDTLGNDKTQSTDADGVGLEHHAKTRLLDSSRSGQQRSDICRAKPLPATKALALAQTLKRARPLARRARSTARPPRVRMRTRNPCVRFLRTTEG